MTERDALLNRLAEIADYFAGCAENAAKGSKAEVHFMVLKNATKLAMVKLMDGNMVRVTRCAECICWEAPSAIEKQDGSTMGHCRNHYGACANEQTDAIWFCADGEREG